MNHQPTHGSHRARGRDSVREPGEGPPASQRGIEQLPRLGEYELEETGPRMSWHPEPDRWAHEHRSPLPARSQERGAGRRENPARPSQWAGPAAASNGAYSSPRRQAPPGQGQTITVSVPALRTFLTLAAVVVLSVVLSVIATITIIAVMNAGVILPQYSRLNQPSQVSQLGICVSKTGKVTTPTNVGFCRGATFVHVQPGLSHP